MANTFISPNMNLVIPIATKDSGPDWANNLDSSLLIIDSHNHTAGSGLQINPTGLNINIDLPFNNNNATLVRTVRFVNNLTTINPGTSPNDIGCIYEALGDLWYNNGGGTASVQITNGSSIVGGVGTISGLPVGGPANVTYSAGTYKFEQNVGQAGNIDVGSVIVRYPGVYPSPTGNFIALQAPVSLSSQITLTLPFPSPSGTQLLQITPTGVISPTTTVSPSIADSVGISMTSVGANAIISKTGSAQIITALGTNPDFNGKAVKESGKNVIVSNTNATNSLAIIRGTVQGGGAISGGEGFSVVRLGPGQYNITFSLPFGDLPVITATLVTLSPVITIVVNSLTTTTCQILTLNTSSVADSAFSFIAIGQRS